MLEPAAGQLIRFDNVSYTVDGKTLLDRLSLQMGELPITAVIGPNGAGKSTMLRLIAGLITPSSGAISWMQVTPPAHGTCRAAMVFQRPVILRRSLEANIRHAIQPLGLDPGTANARLEQVISICRLSGLRHVPARRLSGGEQQKLALARALARHPKVLLLDEPCASLDPSATAAIEQIIRQAAASGTSIVIVTHDIAEARRLADEVVFLESGRLAEQADAGIFFDNPQSSAARDYLTGRLPQTTNNGAAQ